MENRRVHLIVEGRVQGVWFRDSTRNKAASLGVSGWVRNVPDGTVEAVVEGPRGSVKNLIEWCHVGPPAAKVHSVTETEEEWTGEFRTFDIRY